MGKVSESDRDKGHKGSCLNSRRFLRFFPHFIIAFISFYRYYSKRKEKSPVSGTILTCQKASRVFKDLGTTQNMVSYFLLSKSDVAKWLHIFDRIYRNLLCHIGSFYSLRKKK